MSEEEIRRAREEAMRYENEDSKKQELLDIRNKAERILYAAEKEYNERKSNLDKTSAHQLKADIGDLKKAVLRTKPEKITEIQAGQIKDAQAKVEQDFSQFLNMSL